MTKQNKSLDTIFKNATKTKMYSVNVNVLQILCQEKR